MTKRDYQLIAHILSSLPNHPGVGDEDTLVQVRNLLALQFASYFKRDNVLFSKDKFLAACRGSK